MKLLRKKTTTSPLDLQERNRLLTGLNNLRAECGMPTYSLHDCKGFAASQSTNLLTFLTSWLRFYFFFLPCLERHFPGGAQAADREFVKGDHPFDASPLGYALWLTAFAGSQPKGVFADFQRAHRCWRDEENFGLGYVRGSNAWSPRVPGLFKVYVPPRGLLSIFTLDPIEVRAMTGAYPEWWPQESTIPSDEDTGKRLADAAWDEMHGESETRKRMPVTDFSQMQGRLHRRHRAQMEDDAEAEEMRLDRLSRAHGEDCFIPPQDCHPDMIMLPAADGQEALRSSPVGEDSPRKVLTVVTVGSRMNLSELAAQSERGPRRSIVLLTDEERLRRDSRAYEERKLAAIRRGLASMFSEQSEDEFWDDARKAVEKRAKHDRGCVDPESCGVSTGIDGSLTFGSGVLDEHGFWEKPCHPCARASEQHYPSNTMSRWPKRRRPNVDDDWADVPTPPDDADFKGVTITTLREFILHKTAMNIEERPWIKNTGQPVLLEVPWGTEVRYGTIEWDRFPSKWVKRDYLNVVHSFPANYPPERITSLLAYWQREDYGTDA